MSDQLISCKLVDGVGVLSFNRPERHNAISDDLFAQWTAALAELIEDDQARCILLRGEGPSFCSGRDTAELGKRAGGENDFRFLRRHQEIRLSTLDAPKPVVAAVHGVAFGGGFEIALSADIRIAADDAVFALPEITYGLLPDTGGTQLLLPLIGPAKTKFLVMSGERIAANRAQEWGVVDFVVSPADLDEEALRLCRRLAEHSPIAIAAAKQLIDQTWAGAVRSGIRQELLAQTALFASEEYRTLKLARTSGRKDG